MTVLVNLVGIAAIVVALVKLAFFVWKHAIRSPIGLSAHKGEWALITGASDGIGAAFARQLASQGLNVVIMARSLTKLDAVMSECEKLGAQVIIIPFDFASASDEFYSSLRSQLSDVTISVLVNNVGVNVDYPTDFMNTSVETADRIVRVNTHATVEMTRIFLEPMIARKKGIVIFLSSGAGTTSPGPKLSVYAGTKAFVDAFAVALSGELASTGISVHSLRAFFVVSSMSKIRRSSLTVPTTDQWVRSALKVVGRETVSTPFWSHEIMGFLLNLIPLKYQVSYVNKLHNDIQQKAMRKRDGEKKAK
eukprot:Plantae.Rhodophyta-Purpureofilum_apyrenoidigerum.ctg2895.p1 GENE.Plantae.Rhodophyta-Purpureofilum_apyrenoidigerum.ctg2895~~Plantae.Rhodophyta-Purpureofilum_apyrenoidigerum.ctg2895.p1  ORF type:complete len:307 (-),score=48.89 Plantae.Rhodophyta-Purpureofilum_apyrenoidigerum.ctg2895:318-1238(-)